MEIREMIKIVEHFAKGGKIEMRAAGTEDSWEVETDPDWNFSYYEYRIKEEPKVNPWTFENAPIHSIKVKDKDGNFSVLRVSTDFSYNPCFTDSKSKGFISFKEAAEKYIQLDGSPCGDDLNTRKGDCEDCKHYDLDDDDEYHCNQCCQFTTNPNFEPKTETI